MRKKIAMAAFGAAFSLAAACAQAATYTSYYAFGDSLTDDGKLMLPVPYFDGRFSSGPVWADYIAERFTDRGLDTFNLALGGATAGDANKNADGDLTNGEYPEPLKVFATLNDQIDFFASNIFGASSGDNPLVSLFLGANDIFQGGNAFDAANALADGIERLIGLAPTLNDFLISTLPDLGDGVIAGQFNAALFDRLSLLDPEINLIVLDQNVFQADLFPRLGSLGVTNFATPCLVPSAGFDCTIIGFDANGQPIRDLSIADTYYLMDDVHPGGVIQREFGAFALAALEDNLPAAVPLPAGFPLLLIGLGGLFALRRRAA